MALFAVEGWADKQAKHLFIDDPVTSLDDHNLFVTAASICDLIHEQHDKRRIILTTHHFGLFMAVRNYLSRGEEAAAFKNKYITRVLTDRNGSLELASLTSSPILAHLRTLQVIHDAANSGELATHHFVLLRQVLETIGSFLGSARPSHVLEQIGIENPSRVIQQINAMSHKNIFKYEPEQMAKPDLELMGLIVRKLFEKYDFVTHS